MDVIGIVAVLRRVAQRALIWQLCLVAGAVLSIQSCGHSPGGAAAQGPSGTLELNLVGQGSQGTLFRLRDAVVTVQGPDRTLFFNSEDDPDGTSFSAVVPAGRYTSFLQEGWHLERVDGNKLVENAVLISPNPDAFEIVEGKSTRVALRFQAGPDVVVTNPGVLEIGIEVEEQPGPRALCSSDIECAAGEVCCVSGFLGSCLGLDPGASCPLPDLTVSLEVAQASLLINEEFFPPESCAIEEGCVVEPGQRRLLRFSTMTPNIGDSDLVLGDPSTTEGFEFAPCHGHFHFNGYARYELVDGTGAVVAVGHKQAFCLLDSQPVGGVPGASATPRFHCEFQGLQRGWADIYDASLDCQWVDITGVPDGDYLLRVSINPDRVIDESNFDNNTVEVPVTIAPPAPVDPLAACPEPTNGLGRECGWSFAPGFEGASCVPGELLTLGCGCNTPGSCIGDPMLRICEGSTACSASAALSEADDTCGVCPQLEVLCPPSGTYSVLTGSFGSANPFVCDLEGL